MSDLKRPVRLLTYWTVSEIDRMIDHLRKVRPQILQVGQFGPNFYSMHRTPELTAWAGAPASSIRASLDWWKEFIAETHRLDILVVGIFSVTYHYGNHDTGEGWFALWNDWDKDLLGPRPGADPLDLLKRTTDGKPVWSEIPRRPMRQYAGCLNNPAWRDLLKKMVQTGIDIGLDGFNTVYNYMGCHCRHCVEGFRRHLSERYTPEEVERLSGVADPDAHTFDTINWFYSGGPDPYKQECLVFNGLSLKRAQDDIFGSFGQKRKPDLIRATWYHSYGGDGPFTLIRNDERSGLSRDLWAKDETFFWYCLSAEKKRTDFERGYVGDITLEAKYYAAAGRGKPFVVNKYDFNRYRLYIAEAAAHRAMAFGYHWDGTSSRGDREIDRYAGILIRYFGFLERHADLYDAVVPYAEIAIVYGWTDGERGDAAFIRSLKRVSRRMIDRSLPFDIVIDQDMTAETLSRYRALLIPGIRYLSDEQIELLRAGVASGGRLVVTRNVGTRRPDGTERPEPVFDHPHVEILDIPQDEIKLGEKFNTLLPPPPDQDVFGNGLVDRLNAWIAPPLMTTTAPWTTQITPYRQDARRRIVTHCVNYRRDESEELETPMESGSFELLLRLPAGARTGKVRLYSPDMDAVEGVSLPFTFSGDCRSASGETVHISVPSVFVYSVITVEWT